MHVRQDVVVASKMAFQWLPKLQGAGAVAMIQVHSLALEIGRVSIKDFHSSKMRMVRC
jgi:hypothetical protein